LIQKTGRWTVPPTTTQIRLDKFLTMAMPDESRSHIQVWIRNGRVLVNGLSTKSGYSVRAGDEIRLEVSEEQTADMPQPENIPLPILYQDDDIVVLDKPAGLVCHAGAGIRSGTLVNALLFHLGPLDSGDPMRPGIVHRLDKLTSGVMVVARNPKAHRLLSRQFKRREVAKEYLAVVYGCPAEPTGTIDLPLGRDPRSRTKISIRARKKRAAVTKYELVRNYGPVSLLKVKPETGRTHQIRVHLAQKGFPVVGDELYGGNRRRSFPPSLAQTIKTLGRHFLHACRLEFQHPRTGERVCFAASLPPDLRGFLAALPPGRLDSKLKRTI
jgi:23S rRNA pseudouridine1911/1915/1917 synthase